MNFLKLKAAPEVIAARITQTHPEAPDIIARVNQNLPHNKRSINHEQAFALYALAAPYNSTRSRILEIGTARGYSAAVLAEACPLAHITTLNPLEHEVEEAKTALSRYSNVEVVTQKSWDYLEHYIGTGFDVIFVDGDHKNVRLDLPWWEHLRPGGLMLFHDYSPAGSWRECPPVFEACNEFATERGLHEPEVVIRDTDDVGMAGFYKQGDPDKTLANPYHPVVDARSYSQLGLRQLWSLFDLAQTVRKLPGDIVECGCGNGGSAYAIYEGAKRASRPLKRTLVCLGEPRGVPEPGPEDTPKAMLRYRKHQGRWSPADERLFFGLMTEERIPTDQLCYLPGLFDNTFAQADAVVSDIAFLHIDATLYQSTYHCLGYWLSKVVPGGVVAISAYHYWPGIQAAAELFFAAYGEKPGLFRYDDINVAWRVDQ